MRNHAKPKSLKDGKKPRQYTSPHPTVYSKTPNALQRQATTREQVNVYEDTILYGADDAFPLRLANAVQESPAASACIGTTAKFIKGAGFSNKDLMKVKINKYGQTLWDLHCELSNNLALFRGFSLNFKFSENGKITQVYVLSFENVRMVKPEDDLATDIQKVKYNPYFGTAQFDKKFTKCYTLFSDIATVQKEIKSLDSIAKKKTYPGQVYYFGVVTPLHRFYPVPDYWSCKKWIEVDAKIQEFHAENLENGFFQSVLMSVVGDPNAWSKNPRLQKEETASDGVTKIKTPTKTVGEEFNDQMSANFSGSRKAGNVMVQWALNEKDAPKVTAFPSNTNADLFTTLQDLTTKNITIATHVPAILANIHEGVSLGSDGNTMKMATEIMQSNVTEWHELLTSFYNEILIPNLEAEKPIEEQVEIVHYIPVSQEVKMEDKFWEVLTPEEKREFIRENLPNITLAEVATAPPAETDIDPKTGEPLPVEPAPAPTQTNEALKNLKIADLNKIQKIVARYNLSLSDPNNSKAITYEQAKQMLSSYGFTEEELNAWLVTPEEI